MKITEIVKLNCSEKENMEILEKALTKVKWLDGKKTDNETLMQLYYKVRKKYKIGFSYIAQASETSMTTLIKKCDTGFAIQNLFFINFREFLIKTIIVLYAYTQLGLKFEDKE